MVDSDVDARLSKPKLSGGAAPEDVGLADVAASHLSAGVAELGLDGALVAIIHRDLGGVTAAKAVTGVTGRAQSGGFRGALDDQGYRAVAQAVQPKGASPTDRGEQRAVDDVGVVKPGFDRGYRAGVGMDTEGHADRAALALLVGLGSGEPDPDALVAELDPAVAGTSPGVCPGPALSPTSSERRSAEAKPSSSRGRGRAGRRWCSTARISADADSESRSTHKPRSRRRITPNNPALPARGPGRAND
jgi:hypothetical protein